MGTWRGLRRAKSIPDRLITIVLVAVMLASAPLIESTIADAQDAVIRFGASLSLTGRFVDNARLNTA